MLRRRTPETLLGLAALVIGLSSCERGCLGRSLEQHGPGARGPGEGGGAAPLTADQGLDLAGTDCSDGLLRCVDGRVEASRAAYLPSSCRAGRAAPEGARACVCPWDEVARCTSGCASDGIEVIGPPDGGAAQLCRPDKPVARPILPGDPVSHEICASEGVACVDGIVRSCDGAGQPSRALAYCLNGCEPRVGLDDWGASPTSSGGGGAIVAGARKTPDGVHSILCRRDDAERR